MAKSNPGANFQPSAMTWKCSDNKSNNSYPVIDLIYMLSDGERFQFHRFWKRVYLLNTWICPFQWRHNGRDGVSDNQPHDCLPSRLFRRRSKKTSKLRVTGLCTGNSPVNSPHKGPVMRKMLPFDEVIMRVLIFMQLSGRWPGLQKAIGYKTRQIWGIW